jgi:pimeloyl-ACP methyl ester carboxylesterase
MGPVSLLVDVATETTPASPSTSVAMPSHLLMPIRRSQVGAALSGASVSSPGARTVLAATRVHPLVAPRHDRQAKAHYDGIVAFSQTDFTNDLNKITTPVLVMHGDDDQIVPYADAGPLSGELLPNGTLKTYLGFPHGMPITQADTINADIWRSCNPDVAG